MCSESRRDTSLLRRTEHNAYLICLGAIIFMVLNWKQSIISKFTSHSDASLWAVLRCEHVIAVNTRACSLAEAWRGIVRYRDAWVTLSRVTWNLARVLACFAQPVAKLLISANFALFHTRFWHSVPVPLYPRVYLWRPGFMHKKTRAWHF